MSLYGPVLSRTWIQFVSQCFSQGIAIDSTPAAKVDMFGHFIPVGPEPNQWIIVVILC